MLSSAQIPFFRIALALILGILLQSYGAFSLWFVLVFFAVLLLTIVLFQKFFKQKYVLYYVLIHLVFFSAGLVLKSMRNADFSAAPEQLNGEFTVSKYLGTNQGGVRKYRARMDQYTVEIYAHGALPHLRVGHRYYSKKNTHKIEMSYLPQGFDYQKYLVHRDVYFTVYFSEEDTLFSLKKSNFILITLDKVRSYIQKKLVIQFGASALKGLYQAVLLGDKSELSPALKQNFSALGISHFLAVSGLHVGIIYLILSALLGLNRYRRHRFLWAKVFVVLLLIWFYALLSGFGLSVCRASFMFSTFLLGRLVPQGRQNAFNILCFSAVFWLFVNPNNLFDVGFQLSYLAVSGILLFYKPMLNIVVFNRTWKNRVWEVLCLSFSAQLATLPIILMVFGQFPIWFLLSNLWLSLFSFLLTAGGFAFVLLSFSSCLQTLLAQVLVLVFDLFSWGINASNAMPFLRWERFIDPFVAIGLLGMLFVFYLWMHKAPKSKIIVYSGLALFLAYCPYDPLSSYQKHTLYKIQQGYQNYFLYRNRTQAWFFPFPYKTTYQNSYPKVNADALLLSSHFLYPENLDCLASANVLVLSGEKGIRRYSLE